MPTSIPLMAACKGRKACHPDHACETAQYLSYDSYILQVIGVFAIYVSKHKLGYGLFAVVFNCSGGSIVSDWLFVHSAPI